MNLTDQDISLFVDTLKQYSTYDFSNYSDKSLKRRVSKLLLDNRTDLTNLVHKIKTDKSFLEKIVKDITVNTTELFRDPQVWQHLRYRVLPNFENNSNINIWHAGCSTGQEVYSLMILLNEMGLFEKAKIYATDLNEDVLQAAEKGLYKYRFNISYLDNFDKVIKENPYNYDDFRDVPYTKYFDIDKTKDIIRMKEFLREKPKYRKHNLVNEDNIFFIKFDIILCRNVIIYFNYDLQNDVFGLFNRNLHENGCLVLGLHETILGPYAANFEKKGLTYIKV